MTRQIKKVGVIGAGTMGSGIAAQLANAGVDVVLLDLADKDGNNRADLAIERMKKAKPTDAFNAGFMVPENARYITTGFSDKNLDMLGDCDWIIETILAPQKVREGIYKNVEAVAKKDAIFSSNTSTMQIESLTEGQSADFKRRFVNTHFFNPVRFMHLLEVISNDETAPEIVQTILEFASVRLGKKTVHCKDERGFIANRIGIFAMERARVRALEMDMVIEDVDAIMGQAFGFPKLGLFKLADEVGLPVIEHVRTDLHANLPAGDAFQQIFTGTQEMEAMLAAGYLGSRDPASKGGYYRKKTGADGQPVLDAKGKPDKEARDLKTGAYRDFQDSPYFKFEKQIKKYGGFDKFFESGDRPAAFAWPVIRDILVYTLDHAQELAYDLQDVDDAMRAGFNWQYGPFQLLDLFGVNWFAGRLTHENIAVPPLLEKARAEGAFYRTANGQNQVMNFDGRYAAIKREAGVIALADIKAGSKPLLGHNSASLWDIGDGVTALEFHATKNAIDPSIFYVINESIKFMNAHAGQYKGMVIYNDDPSFSFGANLKLVDVFMGGSENGLLRALGIGGYIARKLPAMVAELVYQGQAVYNALHQAPFPVVGAPKGNPQNMAFGGGCEVLLHCDAIQSGSEQIIGLPESGLGLVPGWGGSTRYLQRAIERRGQKGGPMPAVIEAILALANPLASIATCAQDAQKKLWLRPQDGITMNPDRVLADAKARVLALAGDYKPAPQPSFHLPGASGKTAIRMQIDQMYKMGGDPAKGGINHIDVRVADALADIVTGGEVIKRADIENALADPALAGAITAALDAQGHDQITVDHTLPLSVSRLLQQERARFTDRFRDKATWNRVRTTLTKGAPPREARPKPEPAPSAIRAAEPYTHLPCRAITGKVLEGDDAARLKTMAEMTAEFYRLNDARKPLDRFKQIPRTMMAAKRVLDMV